ncbi:MAG: beta-lactamase family protein, partial [Defluviitaleaceae bacterium]|nr:beta-lactamase family protein [Defluviitaleaceae bacterium]
LKDGEHSQEITIKHLLSHTSGLPDYFEAGGAKTNAIKGDFYMSFEDKLTTTKKIYSNFAPGAVGKAHYSDMNFDLLGEIIEKITETPLEKVYKDFIFEPLGLTKTYLVTDENDFVPNIYYKDKPLHRPKALMSYRASGGTVTTARETMLFLKGFLNGAVFPKSMFDTLAVYNQLSFPMSSMFYGVGYMKLPITPMISFMMGKGFKSKGELIGHNGSTSCCAFYYPLKDLYIVCDCNQLANPGLATRVAVRLALAGE